MKRFNRILLSMLLLLPGASAFSQSEGVEMADSFRADGKIYVVVAIILAILLGFIGYLFLLERKLTKIEKLLDSKNKGTK